MLAKRTPPPPYREHARQFSGFHAAGEFAREANSSIETEQVQGALQQDNKRHAFFPPIPELLSTPFRQNDSLPG
jgi:hypothetical protein